MTTWRTPFLTIGLLMVLAGLYFLVPDKTQLYFSSEAIIKGDIWRLVTGHFIHADASHLFWNGLGMAVLGTLIEQHSKTQWGLALLAGIVSVSALLLSPLSTLDNYCGLSGVLNTFLLLITWLEWKLTRSWLMVAIACGSVAKAIAEVYLGESLLTHISWPPYAWSHVAGLAGGFLIICTQLVDHRRL